MHAVFVVPDSTTEAGELLAALSSLPGIASITPLVHELYAVAVIRTRRPDVIFLHADGCADDQTGLLSWLRWHHESAHTILVRSSRKGEVPVRLPRWPDVPVFELPREQPRLAGLLREFVVV
jgi:hypothetical protein